MSTVSIVERSTGAWWRRLALISCLLVALVADATPASAAQHQHAHLYAYWRSSGATAGFWNIDQRVRVTQKAPTTFWALHWTWKGATSGGYMGLQTDGHRFDGTKGEMAIFSLWDATAASGPSCGTFGGEGTGMSCRLAYPFRTDRSYRLRLWRLSNDGNGQWWGAWIRDMSTGTESHIGNLRVATGRTLTAMPMNFSEYFGTAVGCDQVPVSIVDWRRPEMNRGASSYQYGSAYDRAHRGACTGGKAVASDSTLVRVTMGGRR